MWYKESLPTTHVPSQNDDLFLKYVTLNKKKQKTISGIRIFRFESHLPSTTNNPNPISIRRPIFTIWDIRLEKQSTIDDIRIVFKTVAVCLQIPTTKVSSQYDCPLVRYMTPIGKTKNDERYNHTGSLIVSSNLLETNSLKRKSLPFFLEDLSFVYVLLLFGLLWLSYLCYRLTIAQFSIE